jgi:hypothetical protein
LWYSATCEIVSLTEHDETLPLSKIISTQSVRQSSAPRSKAQWPPTSRGKSPSTR